jgi:hypothetical protein
VLFKKPNVIFKPRPIITLISFIIKFYNKIKNGYLLDAARVLLNLLDAVRFFTSY